MTLIKDVLYQDPTSWSIPNLGVAKVGAPTNEQEWEVLRYELDAFVADGEYGRGLQRILSTFLGHLEDASQPAVWVSGFYGSGKSHLLRVLDSLWVDRRLPDGATARGIVHLPDDVDEFFRELDTRQKQYGGRFAASGMLDAGGSSVGLSILSIVFAAAGLPEEYAPARLTLWLRREGVLETVRESLAAQGRSYEGVLPDMYVSPPLAEALLNAMPSVATSTAEVHKLLRMQYPSIESIDSSKFLETLRAVLGSTNELGEVPLTLIVLDELQQFIGDDLNRAMEVQRIVEAVCSEFESRILFVGAGQMAMGSTDMLQKLVDRFMVAVSLQDRDIDQVVRSVVLRKKPERQQEILKTLEGVSGEIDRQLSGSSIEPKGADKNELVPDYPLLPARRRLWERLLRALDASGKSGQLRTQLRIVLDAAKSVADRELGVVVAGDRVYDQLESALQQSAVLPTETAQLIAGLNDGTPEGELDSRIAKVVYLLDRLPKDGPSATGLSPTNAIIVDLLVEDLRSDGERLRSQVPGRTAELANRGILLEVEDETYLLQTPAAAEWSADFQSRVQALKTDTPWLSDQRERLLRESVGSIEGKLKPKQGKSQISRKVRLAFGPEQPTATDGEVPVWVRDGWSTTERTVKDDALSAGTDSALVLVWLPKEAADDLQSAMVTAEAAARTIDLRPVPTTEDGKNAKAGLITQRDDARDRQARLAGRVVDNASVYQAGGNEVAEGSLAKSLTRAVDNAVRRLYAEFDAADSKSWDAVIKRAREGSAEALVPIGHKGEVDDHLVAKTIRSFVGNAGKKGQSVRKQFGAPPYGWPQDAIDGTLYALVAAGKVIAVYNGEPVSAAKLPQNVLGSADFRSESVDVPLKDRLEVRGLAGDLHVPTQGVDDLDLADSVLLRLRELAEDASGPAPLPPPPDIEVIRNLEGESGNARLAAMVVARGELSGLAKAWAQTAGRIPERELQWEQVHALLRHSSELEPHDPSQKAVDAIKESRSLLDDPDPVDPIIAKLSSALRVALGSQLDAYRSAREAGLADLDTEATWAEVDDAAQQAILRNVGLDDDADADIGTAVELIRVLDEVPLGDWGFKIDAIDMRVAKALEQAVRINEPEPATVEPAHAVIKSKPELDAYLEQLRAEIQKHLDDDKTVVI